MKSRPKVNLETKLLVLKTILLPTIKYAGETWSITKVQNNRLNVILMRWLRSFLGLKISDFIRNEDIRLICGINDISTQLSIQRLRYFGHIIRMEDYNPDAPQIKLLNWIPPQGWKRKRGRPHLKWINCIEKDLFNLGLSNVEKIDWNLTKCLALNKIQS